MTKAMTEHNLFHPLQRRAATKADITDEAARAITNAETEQRNAKTARLRAARLAGAEAASTQR